MCAKYFLSRLWRAGCNDKMDITQFRRVMKRRFSFAQYFALWVTALVASSAALNPYNAWSGPLWLIILSIPLFAFCYWMAKVWLFSLLPTPFEIFRVFSKLWPHFKAGPSFSRVSTSTPTAGTQSTPNQAPGYSYTVHVSQGRANCDACAMPAAVLYEHDGGPALCPTCSGVPGTGDDLYRAAVINGLFSNGYDNGGI